MDFITHVVDNNVSVNFMDYSIINMDNRKYYIITYKCIAIKKQDTF